MNGELADLEGILRERLADGSYYLASAELDAALKALDATYRSLYEDRHGRRKEAYSRAIDDVKAQPDWPLVPPEMVAAVLKPLTDRDDHDLDLLEGTLTCTACGSTLSEMASDLAAVNTLRSDVLLRVQQLTAPEEKIERVRVSEVTGAGQALGTPEEVEELLEQLRDHLLKLIASGSKVVLE